MLSQIRPQKQRKSNMYEKKSKEITGREEILDMVKSSGLKSSRKWESEEGLGEEALGEELMEESEGSIREIHIKPLSSGYLVTVGCQKIAVENTATLIDALNQYLTSPMRFQVKWLKHKGTNKLEVISKKDEE